MDTFLLLLLIFQMGGAPKYICLGGERNCVKYYYARPPLNPIPETRLDRTHGVY